MTVTDLRAAVAIPAGWYPDPVDAAGLRWWSGENWTEHTSAPEPVVHAEPAYVEPLAYREPVAVAPARRARSSRDRNLFSGIALVVAVIGLLAFVAGQLLEVADTILYLAGGIPFAIAAVAIVLAIRSRRGVMIAVIAAVLSILNVGMVLALSVLDTRGDPGATLDTSPTFEQVLEQSVVDTSNSLGMAGTAISADCPNVTTPPQGSVTDCDVTFDTGDIYLVHVTSEDGLGGMSFELVPVVIGTAADDG